MGRVLLSAGHGGLENGAVDPGVEAGGTTEAEEMMRLRDATVRALDARGTEVLSVPDPLSLDQTIAWIGARGLFDDIALEIHMDGSPNPSVRGTTAYHIASNPARQQQAQQLLQAVTFAVPQLESRGAKPDTETGLGMRLFCRQVSVPSLILEVGFLTNETDRWLIQNRRDEIAAGIADGLVRILNSGSPAPETFPTCGIRINNQSYPERGILALGNAYIPADLLDRLNVNVNEADDIKLIRYQNVVYARAVDLRNYNISVSWDNSTRSVVLKTILDVCGGLYGTIIGHGSASEVQMLLYANSINANAIVGYPELARLYREEASAEGVNYDLAFSQMCIETDFLRFSGDVRPEQNNFGGLGSADGSGSASFSSQRIGVRAHVQHLKAYGNAEPLVNPVVDPRFNFVARGSAPAVQQLSGRWDPNPDYGTKILSRLRQLYEFAGIL